MNQVSVSPAWVSAVTEAAKLIRTTGPTLACMTILMCIPLLFCPPHLLDVIGLASVAQAWRAEIGLLLLATSAVILVQIPERVKILWREKAKKSRLRAELRSLPADEANLLRYCVNRNKPVIYLPVFSELAASLRQKGLLQGDSRIGIGFNCGFAVPDYVWEHVKKTPEDIGGWNSATAVIKEKP